MSENSHALKKNASALRQLALGAAARGILHDIVNPVNVILMNAELAQMCLLADGGEDEVAAALDVIIKEAKRAGELSASANGFAQADNYTPVETRSLNAMLTRACQFVSADMRRRGVTVESTVEQDRAALCNELAVAAVLARLMVNAADNGAARIKLSLEEVGDSIEIVLRFRLPEAPKKTDQSIDFLLAKAVVSDHGGEVFIDEQHGDCRWGLRLPKH